MEAPNQSSAAPPRPPVPPPVPPPVSLWEKVMSARRVVLPIFFLGVLSFSYVQASAVKAFSDESARKKDPRLLKLRVTKDGVLNERFAILLDFERLVFTEGPSKSKLDLEFLSSVQSSQGPIRVPLHQVVRALDFAATDPRVQGLIGQFGVSSSGPPSVSQCEELAAAIRAFQHKQRTHYDPPSDRTEGKAAAGQERPAGEDLAVSGLPRVPIVAAAAAAAGRVGVAEVPPPTERFSVAFADSLSSNLIGSSTSGVLNSFLALSFGETYVHPSGYVTPPLGISASTPFVSLFFKKYGIHAEFLKCSQYKNAPNTFTESGYTPSHLYATASMLSSLDTSLLRGVLRAKNLSLGSSEADLLQRWIKELGTCPVEVCEFAFDGSLLKRRGTEDVWRMLDERYAGWVGKLAHEGGKRKVEVAEDAAKSDSARNASKAYAVGDVVGNFEVTGRGLVRTVTIDQYIKHMEAFRTQQMSNQRLAHLRYLTGVVYNSYWRETAEVFNSCKMLLLQEVVRYLGAPTANEKLMPLGTSVIPIIRISGTVDRGFSEGSSKTGARSVVELLRAAAYDKTVKAIVLRVDSPGGSPVGSDVIHSAIADFKKTTGKPVIVSMASYAASGGYFVSCNADRIFANRTTLTGSIGVFGGKFSVGRLLRSYGINVGEVSSSEKAMADSPFHDYTGDDKRRLQGAMDLCYDDFKQKVAAGRGLSLERVEEIAKGRVWTGEQAFDLGLVDQIGGLQDAVDWAAKAAGLEEDVFYAAIDWPKPVGFLDALSDALSDGGSRASENRAVLENTIIGGNGKIVEKALEQMLEGAGVRGMKNGDLMLLGNVEVDIDYN